MPKYMEPSHTENFSNKIVIDIRANDEVELLGKVSHAVHIPMNSFLDKVDPASENLQDGLELDTDIFIYCESGGEKAVKACEILEERFGYLHTYYTGGIIQWHSAGFKIKR